MKQIIIILATVLLAIYIGGTLINGGTGSLQTGAKGVVDEINQEITESFD